MAQYIVFTGYVTLGTPHMSWMGPIIRRSKMGTKSNLKRTLNNLADGSSELLEFSSEVLADATGLAIIALRHVKPVGKEILTLPFSFYEGVLLGSGVDEKEAASRAYAVLDKDVASAIKDGSKATGRLLGSTLTDWDLEDKPKV